MTALELAVLGGRLAVAKLLLQKGASMEPLRPVRHRGGQIHTLLPAAVGFRGLGKGLRV